MTKDKGGKIPNPNFSQIPEAERRGQIPTTSYQRPVHASRVTDHF
jgi:hypothetical protein